MNIVVYKLVEFKWFQLFSNPAEDDEEGQGANWEGGEKGRIKYKDIKKRVQRGKQEEKRKRRKKRKNIEPT